jgi:hypothetical protein
MNPFSIVIVDLFTGSYGISAYGEDASALALLRVFEAFAPFADYDPSGGPYRYVLARVQSVCGACELSGHVAQLFSKHIQSGRGVVN